MKSLSIVAVSAGLYGIACGGRVVDDDPVTPSADAGDQVSAGAALGQALRTYTDRCRLAEDTLGDRSTPATDAVAAHWDELLRSGRRSADLDAWLARCTAALETDACHFEPYESPYPWVYEPDRLHPDDLFVTYGAYFSLFGPAACSNAPPGTGAVDTGCIDDLECASARCDDAATCGTCAARNVGLGGACRVDGHLGCGADAFCEPAAEGAKDGLCAPIQSRAIGELCSRGALCTEGSRCSANGDASGTCVALAARGEPCKMHEDCEGALVCRRGFGLEAERRVCIDAPTDAVARLDVGDTCRDSAIPCGRDLYCTPVEGACAELPSTVGAACLTDCRGGLACVDQRCIAMPKQGESCRAEPERRCAAGHGCGADGVCHERPEAYCP